MGDSGSGLTRAYRVANRAHAHGIGRVTADMNALYSSARKKKEKKKDKLGVIESEGAG